MPPSPLVAVTAILSWYHKDPPSPSTLSQLRTRGHGGSRQRSLEQNCILEIVHSNYERIIPFCTQSGNRKRIWLSKLRIFFFRTTHFFLRHEIFISSWTSNVDTVDQRCKVQDDQVNWSFKMLWSVWNNFCVYLLPIWF